MERRFVIKDAAVREVRDDFKLDQFVKSMDDDRKAEYYQAIDHARASYKHLTGREPDDEFLMEALTVGLAEDGVLTEHMRKRTDKEWRARPENWPPVRLAAAGALLQGYVNDCADGTWPQ